MPRTGKEEERRRKKNHRHQMRKNTKSERDIYYYHRAISLLPLLLLLSLVFLSFFSCPTNRMTSASFCFFFSAVAVVAFKLISILVRMLLVLLPTNSVSQSVSLTVIFHLSSFFCSVVFCAPLVVCPSLSDLQKVFIILIVFVLSRQEVDSSQLSQFLFLSSIIHTSLGYTQWTSFAIIPTDMTERADSSVVIVLRME